MKRQTNKQDRRKKGSAGGCGPEPTEVCRRSSASERSRLSYPPARVLSF